MSYLTNYAENKLVDLFRGQAWSLPAALYFGLASAAADGSITELAGAGYARQALTRSLANWSGTQGAGTSTASSGTSHQSSNNVDIDFGTAGSGGWGTANYLVAYDASSSGNALFYLPMDVSLPIAASDPVLIEAANVIFRLGLSGGCSDYLANKLIDFILRGQAYSFPASVYIAACTDAPTNAGGGTEPGVGSYARVAVATSLTAWAGTQSAGSTGASSGTGGETSNNAQITFPTPSADYPAAITHRKVMDASSGGNLLFWAALTLPKTIVSGGSALFYAAGQLKVRFG